LKTLLRNIAVAATLSVATFGMQVAFVAAPAYAGAGREVEKTFTDMEGSIIVLWTDGTITKCDDTGCL
jgi:hypothetical protein